MGLSPEIKEALWASQYAASAVVGPEGEQIYTDEQGRVKVHFPWDRHKDPKAEDSSCWIRVSQAWAGSSFDNIAIPRIGQEVIVDYLEGDPDQPIIMGRTYHANILCPFRNPKKTVYISKVN